MHCGCFRWVLKAVLAAAIVLAFCSFAIASEGDQCRKHSELLARDETPPDEVIQECRRCVENPLETVKNRALCHSSIAMGHAYKYELKEALESYNRAIELYPRSVGPYVDRGNVLRKMGRLDDSLSDIVKGLQMNPNNVPPYYAAAFTYLAKGDFPNSLAHFNRGLERTRDATDYHYLYLLSIARSVSDRQYDVARARLLQHVEATTANADWIRTVSKFFLGLNGVTAETLLDEALKAEGKRAMTKRLCEAFFYLAEARFFDGDREGARELYRKSIETGMSHLSEFELSTIRLMLMEQRKI